VTLESVNVKDIVVERSEEASGGKWVEVRSGHRTLEVVLVCCYLV
jgi:hypothetical protein